MDTNERPKAAWLLVTALSVMSSTAMLGLSQRADERFNPYQFGPAWLERPWMAVLHPLDFALQNAVRIGNFRPVGRVVEHLNYLAAEAAAVTTGLPWYAVNGLLRILSMVVLGVLVVHVANRLAGGRPAVALLTAGAFPTLLVAYGSSSSMVVFSGMYVQTAIVIMLACVAFTRPAMFTVAPARFGPTVAYVLLGGTIALFSELAWVAAPVAGVTLLAMLQVRGQLGRRWLGVRATKLGLATGAGFVAFALPVRWYLTSVCARADASCYVASNPRPGGVTVELLVQRSVAGLPFAAWGSVLKIVRDPGFLTIAVLAGVAIWLIVRRAPLTWPSAGAGPGSVAGSGGPEPAPASADGPTIPVRAVAAWWPTVAVGVALISSAAMLSALSETVQTANNPWMGWREAPVLFAGWALVPGGIGAPVLERLPRRIGPIALAVVAGLGVSAAVSATGFQHARDANDPRLGLADSIAVAVASFDSSPTGDARRCALLDQFAVLHLDRAYQTDRMRGAADDVAQQRYGVPFCEDGPTDD